MIWNDRMRKVLISVVIPIYNCEKYLHNCLVTVVNQTLKDIEIILVNDGSSDGSQNIIDQYSRADSRIIAVEFKENLGVSAARNRALDMANGDYIIFLDADDSWSDKMMLETLLETAVDNNADIVNFGLRLLDLTGKLKRVIVSESQVVDLNQNTEWHFYYSPVTHFVSRKLIEEHSIRFDPVLVMGEDCLFNVTLYCYASKLVVLDKIYYNYQLRSDSANTSVWSKHKLSCTMLWFESAIEVIKKSPAFESQPRLLQELIYERLRMLTQTHLVKAFETYNENELREYIDLCAKNLSHIDNAFFDSQFFPTGWHALPRNTVDMVLKKDLAGLRALYCS